VPFTKFEIFDSSMAQSKGADLAWNVNFNVLKTWILGHQGSFPSRKASTGEEKALARWVNNQRYQYQTMDILCSRVKKLEALPSWRWRDAPSWDDHYDTLLDWTGTPKQNATDPEERLLAHWVNKQRQAFAKGALEDDRVDVLEELPTWTWAKNHDSEWMRFYIKAKEWFFDEPYSRDSPCPFYPSESSMKDADPELRTDAEAMVEKSLAKWIANQKQVHASGKLSTFRTQLLERLPRWTWVSPSTGARQAQDRGWDFMFAEIQKLPVGILPTKSKRQSKMMQSLAIWFGRNLCLFNPACNPIAACG